MNTRQQLALIDAGEPLPDTRPPVDPVILRLAQERLARKLVAFPLSPGWDATRRELLDLEIERLTRQSATDTATDTATDDLSSPDGDIPL
jgi:hypothetical protein